MGNYTHIIQPSDYLTNTYHNIVHYISPGYEAVTSEENFLASNSLNLKALDNGLVGYGYSNDTQ